MAPLTDHVGVGKKKLKWTEVHKKTFEDIKKITIVETLKEFRSILLGKRIKVFTDHKNLVHESELKTSQRVMRWRLLLEEYGPEIEYIKGPKNAVVDALKEIQAKQAKDRDLRQKIKTNPSHFQKTVVEQVKVVTYKNRIMSPRICGQG